MRVLPTMFHFSLKNFLDPSLEDNGLIIAINFPTYTIFTKVLELNTFNDAKCSVFNLDLVV